MKTNREHYSWSQHDMWTRSKRQYWKQYSQGVEAKSNRFYDKGKELATFAETGEVEGRGDDAMLKIVTDLMPRLDVPEQEIYFSIPGMDKRILCFVDSASSGGEAFIEYKTGKIPWTQERVDEHKQLPFYALAFYKKHGFIPNSQLVWVETMDTSEDGLLYTGTVKTFNRDFELKELLALEDEIKETVKEIEGFEYEELEVDNEDVNRYLYLQKVIEEAELELSAIKMKVQGELMEKDVKFGKGENGNFIITERKTWKYSEVIGELKKDITRQQKHEQKMGTASFTTAQGIMFKAVKK
jgi:hypothetical protein